MERSKKILIVGKGGREHALGWRINQTGSIKDLYFTQGNAGTESIGKNIDIDPEDTAKLVRFAKDEKIDLTIASSDRPVAQGIVNAFQEENLRIFGPTREAAKLEWSKAWAVGFMERYNIPHPKTWICDSTDEALHLLRSRSLPTDVVIKPDGLTDGKGVEIALGYGYENKAAERMVIERLTGGKFGVASIPTLIQERLNGKEASVFVLTDGKNFVPILSAADHKTLNFMSGSPMTGGMGGFAPALKGEREEGFDKQFRELFIKPIIEPTIKGMEAEGYPYKGVLYIGIMLTDEGPKVLEYNARFGDPETELQMRLLTADLLRPLIACVRGNLTDNLVRFHKSNFAAGVILATEGYPENPVGGDIIFGLNTIYDPHIVVFHAGTKRQDGRIVTTGGRALMLTSVDKNVERAQMRLRKSIGEEKIHFRGMQYRKDLVGY